MTWLRAFGIPVVGDIAANALEHRARTAIEARVKARFEEAVKVPVTVVIAGRPILKHLANGRVPGLHAMAEQVPVRNGAARLERLEVDLVGINVPPGIENGTATEPFSADGGRFAAWISAADLFTISGLAPLVRRMEFRGHAVRLQLPGGAWFDTSFRVKRGDLVVAPSQSLLRALPMSSLTIRLRGLPAGAEVTSVEISHNNLVARGTIDGSRLEERGTLR